MYSSFSDSLLVSLIFNQEVTRLQYKYYKNLHFFPNKNFYPLNGFILSPLHIFANFCTCGFNVVRTKNALYIITGTGFSEPQS